MLGDEHSRPGYTITNDVHHFPVDYGSPITVPISARCGGSRSFILHAVVSWIAGNPVKIDEGSQPGYRSATHAAVIVRSTAPATMVPDLTGADQSSVYLLLSRSHLITGKVTSVVSLARAGTVIAENSPAGTIEPSSSIVDVTISAGGVAVPELESLTQGRATSELAALGLATRITQTRQSPSTRDLCIRAEAPDLVAHGKSSLQSPWPARRGRSGPCLRELASRDTDLLDRQPGGRHIRGHPGDQEFPHLSSSTRRQGCGIPTG